MLVWWRRQGQLSLRAFLVYYDPLDRILADSTFFAVHVWKCIRYFLSLFMRPVVNGIFFGVIFLHL